VPLPPQITAADLFFHDPNLQWGAKPVE
jgi:hypothetical protein